MPDSPSWFHRFARATARATGRPVAFLIAVIVVSAWAITGPIFGFSDTWQLVINTGTTIATFLMVFLIQHTQYRDSESTQLKLAELIRVTAGAHNSFVDLESLSDEELDELTAQYVALAGHARAQRKRTERTTLRPAAGP